MPYLAQHPSIIKVQYSGLQHITVENNCSNALLFDVLAKSLLNNLLPSLASTRKIINNNKVTAMLGIRPMKESTNLLTFGLPFVLVPLLSFACRPSLS
jgi:hypothetical protein